MTNQMKANIIHMPHFKTKIGRRFGLSEIAEALPYSSPEGGEAIVYP